MLDDKESLYNELSISFRIAIISQLLSAGGFIGSDIVERHLHYSRVQCTNYVIIKSKRFQQIHDSSCASLGPLLRVILGSARIRSAVLHIRPQKLCMPL